MQYVVDLEGNSCSDRQVANLHFNYPGESFTAENENTVIYVITNPDIPSDPSPTSFLNMFAADKSMTALALAGAVPTFAITYMTSTYIASYEAIGFVSDLNPEKLSVSFSQPVYDKANNQIKIHNSKVSGGFGTVYYLLVLFKEINLDGNNSYVNIRMNEPPSREEMLNCETWEGKPAAGCARSSYSYTPQTVVFPNVLPNCMYVVYYAPASDYPLRPILSSNIQNETVVTFAGQPSLALSLALLLLAAIFA